MNGLKVTIWNDLKYGKGYINALKEETEKHFGK